MRKGSTYVETRFPKPSGFEGQENLVPRLRRLWVKFSTSKLFIAFRHSPLNPYHFGVKKVVANTPEQEQEIAREKGLAQYINKNNIRCAVMFDGSVNEEFEKTGKVLRGDKDVSSLIPRDANGKLDLTAEEPILVSIIPLEGISITGHVSIQYKDRVINRVLDDINMEPIYPRYQQQSDYYFVYPSQIGIDPEKLVREMDKHNIRYGIKKYNLFTNNCAKNVAQLLRKLGIKDINFLGPDKLGVTFPTPGNNPFHFGMEDWCMRHGVPVFMEEVALEYKHHVIPDLNKRVDKFAAIRDRYERFCEYLINRKTKSKLSDLRKKTAKKIDTKLGTRLEKRKLPVGLKTLEKKVSDRLIGRQRD